ncbi:MAG: Fe-S cluster assembly protein SufB [Candidatus Terrybacteria bacterium RIFCSPLOWO2_01_FULL_44_24]|uniref:Fe-S cluster assembly protein SufB n=1 Tax=Candidatus Terrybacteria bacterium RIFCSPHIGHO2_01_FULL_43_35 TaxID=1802361 RepID=A0A1G2PFN0_9BACT|nr:MAG: Fe-S cluster assembly protein SufB [Candidatus Terrybacteria bacterium RIFCSPHIGHO2_01_FULL_43_35]OHA49870.1 MAG: Fe-S cluster assembly protein SufB [Candidatus Terrybacteria bacterium RIFCSPHIGHO2_02_FULL_43_14]OHA50705.1 MAG: Fe-S cluster assembly protein SufB [Candidatus Terrybacteria bacterium RIFCSPLOWO2_01_FULL_44_24]
MIKSKAQINRGYKFGFKMPEHYAYKSAQGLTRRSVEELSEIKSEPSWMRDFRLRAFDIFEQKIMPTWGADLSKIDFSSIYSFVRPQEKQGKTWADVSPEIKKTFDRLGIPEAEKKFLAGVSAQYESEVIYHSVQKELEMQGILFCDTDTAVKKYPDIVKHYFSTAIPAADNKFAALNSAFWSGGSFVYVPSGVTVKLPLQAYFRINTANMGQFERTLIIAEPGSNVHYVEGCTAPIYSSDSLHAAVVEIFVQKEARVRYTTIQNWSNNVYNLVTKRAFVEENGIMEWVDGNLGSKITMKYPSVFLRGRGAKGEVLSLAVAGKGQHQDAGGKMIHLAPDTSSTIISKSISFSGGRTSYRGLVKVSHNAKRVKSFVRCDALLLDEQSRSDTYPTTQTDENDAVLAHEASVAKLGDEQLFYLRSRGLNEAQATSLIINGFIEPIVKELPMEYASELNRLIEMQMEGSVG